jgi:hypothetical protein
MKTLCEGSRRPVRGERHQLQSTASRHSSAVCPVCKQRVTVARVLGVMEFPRHRATASTPKAAKPAAPKKPRTPAKTTRKR